MRRPKHRPLVQDGDMGKGLVFIRPLRRMVNKKLTNWEYRVYVSFGGSIMHIGGARANGPWEGLPVRERRFLAYEVEPDGTEVVIIPNLHYSRANHFCKGLGRSYGALKPACRDNGDPELAKIELHPNCEAAAHLSVPNTFKEHSMETPKPKHNPIYPLPPATAGPTVQRGLFGPTTLTPESAKALNDLFSPSKVAEKLRELCWDGGAEIEMYHDCIDNPNASFKDKFAAAKGIRETVRDILTLGGIIKEIASDMPAAPLPPDDDDDGAVEAALATADKTIEGLETYMGEHYVGDADVGKKSGGFFRRPENARRFDPSAKRIGDITDAKAQGKEDVPQDDEGEIK